MATIAAHTEMFQPVAPASERQTTGQLMLAQAKLAAVIYPSLMVVAFVGAIGAAYLNPQLLEPVKTDDFTQALPALTVQPSPTDAPALVLPQGETGPLISRLDGVKKGERPAMAVINHGDTDKSPTADRENQFIRAMLSARKPGGAIGRSAEGAMEVCTPQVTPLGQLLGRTCVPQPSP